MHLQVYTIPSWALGSVRLTKPRVRHCYVFLQMWDVPQKPPQPTLVCRRIKHRSDAIKHPLSLHGIDPFDPLSTWAAQYRKWNRTPKSRGVFWTSCFWPSEQISLQSAHWMLCEKIFIGLLRNVLKIHHRSKCTLCGFNVTLMCSCQQTDLQD